MAALTNEKRAKEKFSELIVEDIGYQLNPPLCLLCDKCSGLTELEDKFHCMHYGELFWLREGWQAKMCSKFEERKD